MTRNAMAFGVSAALLCGAAAPSLAETLDVPTSFDLSAQQKAQPAGQPAKAPETTYSHWDLEGITPMRAADTQEPGTLDFKNFARWSTSSDGSDDDLVYEVQAQWGMAENLQMTATLPINFGDGSRFGFNGNPDLTVGWQWRFLEEQDWIPGTAVFFDIRTPTGYHSGGSDQTVGLALTKSLVPDQWRLHVNGFAKWLDGHYDPDGTMESPWDSSPATQRNFEWGVIIGSDYKINETTGVAIEYHCDSGEVNGYRVQHELALSLGMTLENGHELLLAGTAGLDGDSQGPNFGASVGYLIPLAPVARMSWASYGVDVPYPTWTSGE